MKLTVIGGGGVRSLFLAKSLAMEAEASGLAEIVLMDSDERKLEYFGHLALEGAKRLAPELKFSLTSDPVEAVRDADYVITTIRVGGDAMRVEDEKICLKHGVLAQETTGAGALSFAMRSLPTLAKYCELIRRHAKPDVKVFNFTNPAGLVSQGLRDLGYDFTYGICDAPTSLLQQIARMLGVEADRVSARAVGLNHLSWFPEVYLDGEDITTELIRDPRLYVETDMQFFEPELVERYGMLFNEYLYYYYYREVALKNIQQAKETRGQQILRINTEMMQAFEEIKNPTFDEALALFEHYYGMREDSYMASETGKARKKKWSFDLYAPDPGGYAGVALGFIRLENSAQGGRMIMNLPNNGAISYLKDDDVIEQSIVVSSQGVRADQALALPAPAEALIQTMKAYERQACRAIEEASLDLAADALQMHPLIQSYSLGRSLAEDFFKLNEDYLEVLV